MLLYCVQLGRFKWMRHDAIACFAYVRMCGTVDLGGYL